ncbi:hypothetical protein [Natronorubrum texcoconense]|uniref:Solute:sodium symporter small subunit n=1 Tax=Natronorubrum texcoconense TaxID=1095776 RepID=A0A1G8YJC0_9EURY|nr:hypothetical protein [Natronorubrum texcoconense]SDK02200.1 hypothetical protein SAMN04515672_2165 [Natronorubrum texcoconense]
MSSRKFSESPRETFRWLIGEGVIIAGVFLFWTGVMLAIRIGLSFLQVILEMFGIQAFFVESLHQSSILWQIVLLVTGATVALYILVQAGTILIDRYQQSEI